MNEIVSIIIPVYNGENYLEQAILSAMNQTYKHIEIVIVNDGSIDGTKKIIECYRNRENIVVINKKNGGISSALNAGIQSSKGTYICWLSHDDLYCSNRIEYQLHKLKSLNEDTIIVNNYVSINPAGKEMITVQRIIQGYYTSEDAFEKYLLEKTDINGCAIMIKKSLFEKYGFFDENYKYLQDKEMWIRFMQCGINFYFDKTILVKTRRHPNQTTITKADLFIKEDKQLAQKIIKTTVNTNQLNVIYSYCYTKEYKEVCKLLEDKINISILLKLKLFLKKSIFKLIINKIKNIYHYCQRKFT